MLSSDNHACGTDSLVLQTFIQQRTREHVGCRSSTDVQRFSIAVLAVDKSTFLGSVGRQCIKVESFAYKSRRPPGLLSRDQLAHGWL